MAAFSYPQKVWFPGRLPLRNKLLLFRLRNFKEQGLQENELSIEPRVAQVFSPLLSTIDDSNLKEKLILLAKGIGEEMREGRSFDMTGRVLEATLQARTKDVFPLTVKVITEHFNETNSRDLGADTTPRRIGSILRNQLFIHLKRRKGVFMIPIEEYPRLEQLKRSYFGGDVVDIGDV